MIKKLFERWNRHRVIMDRVNGEPYLERYYVFLKDRNRFPFNIFVHKFLKSDPDDVHDHPWPYFTIILKVATGSGCQCSMGTVPKYMKYCRVARSRQF
jgi:hypothetical protein